MTTYIGPPFRGEALEENGTSIIPGGVVELRVHGVSGGSPEQNLGDPHPIRISGDETAGIYRRRSELKIGPDRVIEAYNWSGINSRKSVRAWWLLLFPFAAANLAGWMLPTSTSKGSKKVAQGATRVVSLAVTFIAVVGMGSITVDIVGVQCGGSTACTSNFWLGWLDSIVSFGPIEGSATRRATLFSLVPLLALAAAWFVGRHSQRYEAYGAPEGPDRRPAGKLRIDEVRLNEVEFWQAPDAVYVQAWIHATVAISGMALVMAVTMRQLAPAGVYDNTFGLLMYLSLAWTLGAGLSILLVGRMHQIPGRWLRKAHIPFGYRQISWIPPRIRPRLTWIPPGGAMVLLGSTLWLGWYSEAGSYDPPLEGFRNALMVATLVGLVALAVLGFAIHAHWFVVAISAIGLGWFLVIWGKDASGSLQRNFMIGGSGNLWLMAEFLAFVTIFGVYWFVAERRENLRLPPDQSTNPLWIMFGAGVVSTLGLGAVARSQDAFTAFGATLVLVMYLLVMFWVQVRNGDDLPATGRMRDGTAMMMAAIGLISMLTLVASTATWVARTIGTGIADPAQANTQFSTQNAIYYPAEAGWLSFAAFAAILTFAGILLLRIIVLHFARWSGKESDLCAEYDCDDIPADGYDLTTLAPDGRTDQGLCPTPAGTCSDHQPTDAPKIEHDRRQLTFANKARRSRMFANMTDDVDWVIAAAVTVALGIMISTAASRSLGRLPTGWLSSAIGTSTWVIGFVAVATMLAVRKSRENLPLRQSFGILWDVTSFFPRRFHPLAPPCYAERSVIELRNRIIWLQEKPDAKTIVVAHSEGTLLTAAALLSLKEPLALQNSDAAAEAETRNAPRVDHPEPTGRELDNIAWVTYGCMLGRLFGRAWPDQLQLAELQDLKARLENLPPATTGATTEGQFPEPPVGRIPRWMNFGRYTDYLGGRVFGPVQPKPTRFSPKPERAPERRDDVFFRDPTRRWRYKGQAAYARLWRHSFNYESDAEDPRFRRHIWDLVRYW